MMEVEEVEVTGECGSGLEGFSDMAREMFVHRSERQLDTRYTSK